MARPISPDAPATNATMSFRLYSLFPPLVEPAGTGDPSTLKFVRLKKFGSNERIRSGAYSREREPSAFGRIEQ